jgi:hypothetical protein
MQKLYRQAKVENTAVSTRSIPALATESGSSVANMQLSDHNLPMHAAATADHVPESIEWLMRAKPVKEGFSRFPFYLHEYNFRAVACRIDGSEMKPGFTSSIGKPFTADGGDADTAYEEDDLITWAS